MALETGPHVKTAAICESVIEGKDGVLSLIRIIDRLTITAAGPEAPSDMPPISRTLTLVVMLISGRARGTHNVEVRVEKPDATTASLWNGTVFLEGEDRGANLVIEISTEYRSEGLYWFDLFFDAAQMTRVPFRIIYQRVAPGMQR